MKNKWIFLTLIGVAVLLPAMGGLGFAGTTDGTAARPGDAALPPIDRLLVEFGHATGLYAFLFPANGSWIDGIGRLMMVATGLLLVYLAIHKKFEPLLLLPIGIGAIMSNIPLAGMNEAGGILYDIYTVGIKTQQF